MASAADATTNGPAASTAQESEAPVAAADGFEASDLPKDSSAATEQGGAAAAGAAEPPSEANKWPGWPGDNVFRMIVPVTKVGSIIGRKGELIKKMCEETGARIRILEGALGTNDRIVLVSGKEEPEAQISPAMDGVIRVFKRINGISDSGGDGASATALAACSARLLVASSQAISLIGKGGGVIKSIQEGSGGSVRVLPGEELPFYATSDERIVDIQGDSTKVVKALELVLGHLRKFLVDHGVIPLFEKSYNSAQPASIAQDRVVDTWADKPQSLTHPTGQAGIASEFSLSLKRDPLFREQEPPIDSQSQHSGLSLYGQDPVLSGLRSSGLGRTAGAFVTQITQSMQIPLSYAEDIIGIGGANIAYIRRTSGAILSVQESRGLPDEITVEIKGTSTQVQTAQQLIQEFIAGHKEPAGTGSGFGNPDAVYTSPYSRLGSGSYLSSLASQSLGGYGSSGGLGGYGGYRF